MLSEWGYGQYHANLIWRYLYIRQVSSFDQMTELNPNLRELLERQILFKSIRDIGSQRSTDGLTTKYLLTLEDGNLIESVVMKHNGLWGTIKQCLEKSFFNAQLLFSLNPF